MIRIRVNYNGHNVANLRLGAVAVPDRNWAQVDTRPATAQCRIGGADHAYRYSAGTFTNLVDYRITQANDTGLVFTPTVTGPSTVTYRP